MNPFVLVMAAIFFCYNCLARSGVDAGIGGRWLRWLKNFGDGHVQYMRARPKPGRKMSASLSPTKHYDGCLKPSFPIYRLAFCLVYRWNLLTRQISCIVKLPYPIRTAMDAKKSSTMLFSPRTELEGESFIRTEPREARRTG